MSDHQYTTVPSDAGTRAEEARALLARNEPGQAIAILASLRETNTGRWLWMLLAECHKRLGDADAELMDLQQALAIQPDNVKVHVCIAGLMERRGDLSGAIEHYEWLSRADPTDTKLLMRLTHLAAQLGRFEQEAEVWRRLLALEPRNIRAHHRLSDLYWDAGRPLDAIPHLRRVLEGNPHKTKLWRRLGEALEEARDLSGAATAWSRVLEQWPADPEAAERVARVRLAMAGRPRGATRPAPAARLVVLGNCQAYVMAKCLRALNPGFEVTAVGWAELKSDAQVQRTADVLEGVDAVITQPNTNPRFGPLTTKSVGGRARRTLFFPAVNFTGFHPDVLFAPQRRRLPSLIGEWHSVLILAGYRLGLPPERTAELFNAYVYGALGYFDEYAKAEQFLFQRARQVGWEIAADLETWRGASPFVHTPNHPKVVVMMSLARRACASLDLEVDPAAGPPPDPLKRFGQWPIYPEVGKRMGLPGELVFVSSYKEGRAFALDEAIDWFYDAYANTSPEMLDFPRVEAIACALRAEGV